MKNRNYVHLKDKTSSFFKLTLLKKIKEFFLIKLKTLKMNIKKESKGKHNEKRRKEKERREIDKKRKKKTRYKEIISNLL